MTIARRVKIDLSVTPYYHCMTRCVRRTYLCGQDKQTGQDFSHRKAWIVNRIKQLSTLFAIHVCAYAVMSNHYHVVLFVNETQAQSWTDNDIISRWAALFPHDAMQLENELSPEQVQEKLSLWRERLMCISWFMRCLNEPIARFSNHEDNCTGRFWEGRFKSQALLDEAAVLSAMAYVDLNPIRAKEADTPETSQFTSIYERIQAAVKSLHKKMTQSQVIHHCNEAKQPSRLMPLYNRSLNEENIPNIPFNLADYLTLVDTTGKMLREDKPGAIPHTLAPILQRLHLTPRGWMSMVKHLEEHFSHAIGEETLLIAFGARYAVRAPKGSTSAKHFYCRAA